MNKGLKTAIASLPFTLSAPFAAMAGSCTVNNTGANEATVSSCVADDGTNGLSNLRRDVDLQASAGVVLYAEDAGNDIAVGAAHESGSAAFGGISSGGSVTECADNNCPNNMDSNASNAAGTAWTKAGHSN